MKNIENLMEFMFYWNYQNSVTKGVSTELIFLLRNQSQLIFASIIRPDDLNYCMDKAFLGLDS